MSFTEHRYWLWRGIDATGHQQRGLLAAKDHKQAHQYLSQKGITPIRMRRFFCITTPCCSAVTLTQWLHQLQQLLTAGIALPQALSIIERIVTAPSASLLTQYVQQALGQGHRFTEAIQCSPYARLPPIEQALLTTAEHSSELRVGIAQLVTRRQQRHEWQRQYRQQLRYPLTLVVAGIGTLAVMMKMVVPRFAQLYAQSGHPLPWLTQALIQLTSTMTASIWPYVVIISALGAGWYCRHSTHLVRIITHVPVVATLYRHQLAIALIEQLQLNCHMAWQPTIPSHTPLDALMHTLHRALATGAALSDVLCSCRSGSRPLFANEIVHLLRIAEHTGHMDDVLAQARQLLEQRSEHYRHALTAWLEPLLLLSLGLIIGALMLSLYLPILDMKDVMT